MNQPKTVRAAGMGKFEYHRLFVADEQLTHAEVRVMAVLWDFSDRFCDESRPGRARIQSSAHVSRRKCDEALKKLLDGGYLTLRQEGGRGEGGKPLASVYALSIPPHWPEHSLPLRGNDPVDNPRGSSPLRGKERRGSSPLREQQFPPEGAALSPSGSTTLPPEGEPIRSLSYPDQIHASDAAGAPPPAHAHASPARGQLDDAESLDWGSADATAQEPDPYAWGTSTPGAEDDRPAQESAPTEPIPSTKQPAQDTAATDLAIGSGRQALREYLARAKTETTTR